MDIAYVGYGMLAASVLLGIGSILYLRRKQLLNEKALIYGVLANLMVQLFAFFFVFIGDFLVVVMNALFLAVITYNMFIIFGFRLAKIYEKDSKSFTSFFVGNAVLANAIGFALIAIASLSFLSYQNNEAFVAAMGQDTIDQLVSVLRSVTIDHLGSLLLGTLSLVFVTYASLKIFIRAHQIKTAGMNFKGLLVLFAFYVINLYVPNTVGQEWMQMILYAAIAFASVSFMKQVQNAKPKSSDTMD